MDDDSISLQPALTSTMGNVLLSQNNDKQHDANDYTPTSSTDAASSFSSTSINASDDPISSTSSDVSSDKQNRTTQGGIKDMEVSKNILSSESSDVDLLDITQVSSEPISEDVEDIVQDLENLLGEPEPVNDFASRRKETLKNQESCSITEKDSDDSRTTQENETLDTKVIIPSSGEGEEVGLEKNYDESEQEKEKSVERVCEQKNIEKVEDITETSREYSEKKGESVEVPLKSEVELEHFSELNEIVSEKGKNEFDENVSEKKNNSELSGEKINNAVVEKVVEEIVLDKVDNEENKNTATDTPDYVNSKLVEKHKIEENSICDISDQIEVQEISEKSSSVILEKEETEEKCEVLENERMAAFKEETEKSGDIQEPTAVIIDELLENINPVDTPKTSELIEELIESVVPNIEEKENNLKINEIDQIIPGSSSNNEENVLSVGDNRVSSEKNSVSEELPVLEDTENIGKTIKNIEVSDEKEEKSLESQSVEESNDQSCTKIDDKTEDTPFIVEAITVPSPNEEIEETTVETEENEAEEVSLVEECDEEIKEESISDSGNEKEKIFENKQKEETETAEIQEETSLDITESSAENKKISSPRVISPSPASVIEETLVLEIEKNEESKEPTTMAEEISSQITAEESELSKVITEENEQEVEKKPPMVEESSTVLNEVSELSIEEIKDTEDIEIIEEIEAEPIIEEVDDSNITIEEPEQLEEITDESPKEEETVKSIDEEPQNEEKEERQNLEVSSISSELSKDDVRKEDIAIQEEVEDIDNMKSTDVGKQEQIENCSVSSDVQENKICSVELQGESEIEAKVSQEKENTEEIQSKDFFEIAKIENSQECPIVEQNTEQKETKMTIIEELEGKKEPITKQDESTNLAKEKDESENIIEHEIVAEEHVKDIVEQVDVKEVKEDRETLPEEVKELVPVQEEIIVKKTIIYEHDCDHHKEKKSQLMDEKIEAEESIKVQVEESIEAQVEESIKAQVEESIVAQVEESIVPQIKESMEAQVEESIEAKIEQQTQPVETVSIVLEENEDSSSSVEFIESSSSQEKVDKEDSNSSLNEIMAVVQKRSMSQLAKTELKNEQKKNEEQIEDITLQDQTTAAVQSILDNMLAEEKNVVTIADKEDSLLVHSSYSSYELQKAVQQIQDISKMDEEEEVVNYIPEVESDVVEKVVHVIEAEVDEISDDVQEVVEQIPEVISDESDKLITVAQSLEEETTVESSKREEKEDVSTKSVDVPMVQPSVDLSEDSSEESSEEDKKTNEIVSSTVSQTLTVEVKEAESSNDNILSEEATKNVISERTQNEENDKVETEIKTLKTLQPSLDLSEDSSNDSSEEDKSKNRVSSTVSSSDNIKEVEVKTKTSKKEMRGKKEKPQHKDNVIEPLSISIEESDKERHFSPKITIKTIREDEEEHKGSLKITITKQSDNTHSILKICSPEAENRLRQNADAEDQNVVPKLVIKTSEMEQLSPKVSGRSLKQSSNVVVGQARSGSPRITIKPIPKPDKEIGSPLKITIKPMGKPEEFSKQQQQQQQRHSPKTQKNKSCDEDYYGTRSKVLKSSENSEVHSPKVTIKPIMKPSEEAEQVPKLTIRPMENEAMKISPKITIKPVVRQQLEETEVELENNSEVKERIVLKINKGTIPQATTKEGGDKSGGRKREHQEEEKLAKIKLKFSKGGDAHIVHDLPEKLPSTNKRGHDEEKSPSKRMRANLSNPDSDDDVKIIEDRQSPIVISEDSQQSQDSVIFVEDPTRDPLALTPPPPPTRLVDVAQCVVPAPNATPTPRKRGRPRKVPLVAREEFANVPTVGGVVSIGAPEMGAADVMTPTRDNGGVSQSGRPKRSCRGQSVRDTLGIKPRKQKATNPKTPKAGKKGQKGATKELTDENRQVQKNETPSLLSLEHISGVTSKANATTTNSKFLELKGLLQAAKDQNIIEVVEIDSPENSILVSEEDNINSSKDEIVTGVITKAFDVAKEDEIDLTKEDETEVGVSDDVEMQPPTTFFAAPLNDAVSTAMDVGHSGEIAMFEEETRMSAEASSRAQTPAKQVVSVDVVEESQSSMQSTATTESVKNSRRSRLEVHHELEAVCTADQLNEYYWGGNGPFMIQEQVAQFLGIKSFKRKYPNIQRKMVEMQERDYIRENGLASESMCDLGLTAVNSSDILDIMYTDFQDKYEEYCKYQREKQAKDMLNKQKALSVPTGQEKGKLDIADQAVHSAAAYNANFNKVRKEQRKACMDLQTMNVHYPRGKVKKITTPKIGNYPVALVPGQFTDYYREFTPTELNNLPLNTMLYTELHRILPELSDSGSESSGSDSEDSSSSGSDSDSSCGDSCKMCNVNEKRSMTPKKSPIRASV